MLLEKTVQTIGPLDREAMKNARRRVDSLIKPPGSLGRLEELAVQLAGIQGRTIPEYGSRAVILMAGDHGVVSEGVSAAPREITYQMLSAFTGGVAGISVLSRMAGADLVVVDVGVAVPVDIPGVLNHKVREGTGNITAGPAMSREEAVKALEAGIRVAADQIESGRRLLATGDMGIGNTTPSSAILAVLAGIPPEEATGRGTMVNDRVLERKVWAVKEAIRVNRPDPGDGIDVVSKVGGLEIAGLAGVILGAASRRIPVVIDGFISTAAAMVACAIKKEAREFIIPSHLSGERGHAYMLEHLGLKPLLHLDMRLGEGTGAVLAMGIVEAACRIMKEMASFEQAGLSDLDEEKLQK
ncbi:MAG: nicotinate-nucleotide--dimethylbenzimidazole phosphoribosyltransferase [Peptococcaceae bacterium]|nr:nicotinate-nucleotide--dimethylbenzimidazole phosphoribosyltransferase [Peptococcaceae bacterium]